jgi:hypothetical protein
MSQGHYVTPQLEAKITGLMELASKTKASITISLTGTDVDIVLTEPTLEHSAFMPVPKSMRVPYSIFDKLEPVEILEMMRKRGKPCVK